ncbi:MAG: carbohydrate binding domain-containing protein [Chitinophagaceae bacterium]|nr:carbohydrate binding domain-containing protein [Chitinophagaceae bacterium]
MKLNRVCLIIALAFISVTAAAQKNSPIVVNVNKPGAEIQSTMYGVFFEDINFAADGGIYAELVKNRSFEFSDPWMGWDRRNQDRKGSVLIINRGGPNPRFARITVSTDTAAYALTNEGFRGIGIKKDNTYHFSLNARMEAGATQDISIRLIDAKGAEVGNSKITITGGNWKQYKASIIANTTSPKASLRISFDKKVVTDIDMVSLFPQDTWKGRPGGLRNDLVQWLADMKPGFVRFPGGCIVEGRELATRYQWKKTVGEVDQRELSINRWNTEFRHRATPDYYQSFGLGFYEYFLLSEDIGASPLPIINCGMACQFNTGEVVPLDELDPYIQDALDLIEFANGSVETKWGKLRASMGHAAPFNLRMLGVGNEQWGPQYVERYKIFSEAIRKQYPDIKLVVSLGPNANGPLFEYLDPKMRELKADILDEHYYLPPEWFQANASRYDNYDRNGPKIFAGEYAAHVKGTEGIKRNNWLAALSEAAFITGLERNADVVHMSSYAPLFAHAEAWQWAPDLIWYDNLRSYGTPSYYVQQLFSVNKGTQVLPLLKNNGVLAGNDSLYGTASIDRVQNQIIIKLVNLSYAPHNATILLEGLKKKPSQAAMTILSSATERQNSFEEPAAISPIEKTIQLNKKNMTVDLAPYSLTILRIPVEKASGK